MGFGKTLGERLAVLFSGISVICGIIVYTVPDLAHNLMRYLTHSDWQFTIRPFNPIEFVGGAVLWAIIGFVIGTAFSKLCECKEKK